ncbi:MAG: mannose-6-phosphate isomerase, class I [Actinocatenispora sp.]
MRELHGSIQPYAWGSRTAIAAIQGRSVPSASPEAELWLGAHPAAPSTVDRDGASVSLAELVADDPDGTLGPAARFGRLPFLLKVLAADEPLSLQAHPDAGQARHGFGSEEAAHVPLGVPSRNYADPYHKPEMICALTDFDCLCGFRDPAESAELLASLAVPALEKVVSALRGPDGLRAAVTTLLELSGDSRDGIVAEAVAAAGARAVTSDDPAYRLLPDLGARYPGDPGVLVAVLLNHVRLRPGQALYAPAGYLHAYLRGVGVEIMAASDNVLRGGLTRKHVDVPELLRVLRFESGPPPVSDPVPEAPGLDAWPPLPGVTEFTLRRARVGGPYPRVTLSGAGPRVLLCLSGRVVATDASGELSLGAGQAAFVPASLPNVRLAGYGEVYQASIAY